MTNLNKLYCLALREQWIDQCVRAAVHRLYAVQNPHLILVNMAESNSLTHLELEEVRKNWRALWKPRG